MICISVCVSSWFWMRN